MRRKVMVEVAMGLLRTTLHHAEPDFRKKTIKYLDGLKQKTKGKLPTLAVHDLSVDDVEKKIFRIKVNWNNAYKWERELKGCEGLGKQHTLNGCADYTLLYGAPPQDIESNMCVVEARKRWDFGNGMAQILAYMAMVASSRAKDCRQNHTMYEILWDG
ncbi:uncharacterized protein ASPGLDRAFT_40632 [Aspergillus glaucus CBS 516.65]|uniref:Uncharacterized protein n=1 Tax=Aspergillus glaucus CBS 516.65 TaxID=1160497 RepID=A0A1L9V3U6_ASPGL|nr:hypothetical protein ASPGLDRAFT_40632 [Aspergillus glaucus CBS 516.65]OJJ78615.1 hypothetical protein ASPGLDRAFT_40632 [Aspergillus glaucus CBS 516.65]